MTPLYGANLPAAMPTPSPGGAGPAGDAKSFAGFMLEAIGEVNAMQHDADHAVEQLVSGGEANMAEVFTAVQKADMSFRMLLQIRNKMLQAYDEIKDIRI